MLPARTPEMLQQERIQQALAEQQYRRDLARRIEQAETVPDLKTLMLELLVRTRLGMTEVQRKLLASWQRAGYDGYGGWLGYKRNKAQETT